MYYIFIFWKSEFMKSLFTLLVLLISFSVNATQSECQQHQCLAVVDAGSSGSRLHIYAYDLNQNKTPTGIKEVWSKKIKPGLASLEPNQTVLNPYLSNLFAEAPAADLPVYFYATAGMRMLSQPKQKKLYESVQNWFANQPTWQLKTAKTLKGAEEGFLAWLRINYQLGRLDSEDKSLVGVMDMGGASVQIIFPIEKTEGLDNNDVHEFNLNGQQKKLFIHSFLGLGQDEVTHQYLDAPSCFANDYELPNGLAGKGDADSCQKAISLLMNKVHQVDAKVQPALAENPVKDWFVLGSMADLATTKPFQFTNNQLTNESLLEEANNQVCQQPWSTLSNQFASNDYLYGYCLFPAYYYALIVDGYGIPATQRLNMLASNQGGDWTMGVVLNQKA